MRTSRWLAAAALLLAAAVRAEPPAAPDTADDEKLLREAGVPVDGPALVEFFRKRVPAEVTPDRLAALVRQLGDDDFDVRDRASAALRALGARALPALRRAAGDPDAEVKRRAEDCLAAVTDGAAAARTAAAARLLAARKPPGAAAALLAYLPFAEDEAAADELLSALVVVGAPGGKVDPIIGAALSDPEPARRAAAALLLGRHGSGEQRAAVRRLLADADPVLRLRAAQGLLAGREKAAVPPLLALFGEAPPEVARQAEDLLRRAAGEAAPAAGLGEGPEQRARCRDAWERWWKGQEAALDLTRADVDLEAVNPATVAREAVRRLVGAWFDKGDAAAVKKMLDPPFRIDGMALTKRAELDEIITMVATSAKEQKAKTTLLETVSADEFLKRANQESRQALDGMPRSELRVVYVKIGTDNRTYGFVARVRGGRGKVISIGAVADRK